MSDMRGNRMAMIFQEPMTSLNPAYTIGNQLEEALLRHRRVPRSKARERARLPAGARRHHGGGERLGQYPHQLSGGLRQRVMIAMALMCGPVADPRRRADHGAGRHHPGADPASAGRAAARVRHGAGADHARPRHRRAHRHRVAVMYAGAGGGDGPAAGDLRGAGASLHAWPAGLHSGARPHAARRAAGHHPRHGAVAGRRDARLPFRRALPARRRRRAAQSAMPLEAGAAADHLVRCIRHAEIAAARARPHRAVAAS